MKKIFLILMCIGGFYSLFAQNVGIGTSTPAYKLTVTTAGQGYGIVHTNGSVSMGTYLTAGSGWLGTVTNHPLHFFTNDGTPTMSINSGNVGIGTVTPSQKLDVQGNVFISNNLGIGTSTPGSPLSFSNALGKKISFWNGGTNIDYGIGIQSGAMQIYTGGSDLITFGYGSSNAFNETMRFATGSGQLMIGTSQAAGKLHLATNGEALRLSGSNPFLTFFDGSNNYKGYMWNNAGNIEIGTDFSNTNGEVSLKTKAVQGLTVQNDGRVRVGALGCVQPIGVGGELPKFSVFSTLGMRTSFGNQIAEWTWYAATQSLELFYNGGSKAYVDADDGDWIGYSDIRLKEDFKKYKSVLHEIKKLDVLTYHYKADKTGTRSFGLVAQNVQQYFPEIVSTGGPDGMMGIAYGKTGVLAIKAIQEQQVIIETLEKKIEMLEKRLAALENKAPNP